MHERSSGHWPGSQRWVRLVKLVVCRPFLRLNRLAWRLWAGRLRIWVVLTDWALASTWGKWC